MTAQLYEFPMSRVKRWPLSFQPIYDLSDESKLEKMERFLLAVAKFGHRWGEYYE